jgi:sugar O-acyltransferase (sialic acid O-acetyltransferase NeuD family)
MAQRIVIVGASGHAKVVADIVEREGKYAIAGLIDSFREAGASAFGYRILGSERDLSGTVQDEGIGGAIVAIGDNWHRARMAFALARMDIPFVSAVHPSAIVARDVALGAGTVVMANAVVNPGARLGMHCIVNTRVSIDHDCTLGDFASVAPGATLGGEVVLGDFAAVGLGADVIHQRRIGAHAVIGAGALVLRDVPGHCVAYGMPARVIRSREEGEPYLQRNAAG